MSAASSIMASLGTYLEGEFADHRAVYGLPVYDGTFAGVEKLLRIHYGQEPAALVSQTVLGGRESVTPWIAVTISQPVDSTDEPDTIERASAIWDLAASLRSAIFAWIISTVSTPVSDVGTVSYVDSTTTPSQLDFGGNTGAESVTVQTTIKFTRNAGGA